MGLVLIFKTCLIMHQRTKVQILSRFLGVHNTPLVRCRYSLPSFIYDGLVSCFCRSQFFFASRAVFNVILFVASHPTYPFVGVRANLSLATYPIVCTFLCADFQVCFYNIYVTEPVTFQINTRTRGFIKSSSLLISSTTE